MILIYRTLINIIFVISPLIIILRLIKKKEDLKRFKEKYGFFTKKRSEGILLWFHGASVGEIQSIIPLLEKFEKDKRINQILITSNTISSSKIIKKFNLKKTIHQFFPIDTDFILKKFIRYWRPSKAFFIDSEIWPNTIEILNKNKIPTILLNARITKKSFDKWMIFSSFAKSVFGKFNLCLSSSKESEKYLKKLGASNIKFYGNLKFSQSEKDTVYLDYNLKKFINSRKSWCASSTHNTEEKVCALAHLKLKRKYKNLLTIIIPRHINRTELIKEELNKLNLKVHLHEPKKKIPPDTDIYLVNSYGKTKSFYKIIPNVFLGGSFINHGGQNPLEAVRYGCLVLHGPNVWNFKEIFRFLRTKNLSMRVNSQNDLVKTLEKTLNKKTYSKKFIRNLRLVGINILKKTYKEIGL
ncbi:3-deoxy-D-manno-octulosonic acid transferase [Pelagibacterales bacterium SAG-MED13]|nr:3-deoxy-D-manno-octulosonic acid transferase [Pelagibacterales bacterium SAG-MED13]|tara:strand:- start:1257 stop:2492 length:1236 start_codon:yes stop_codon:yes gene_type:complete